MTDIVVNQAGYETIRAKHYESLYPSTDYRWVRLGYIGNFRGQNLWFSPTATKDIQPCSNEDFAVRYPRLYSVKKEFGL
jgi:hypothetical protein